MKKYLFIVLMSGATLGLNAQHNYDNQSVIYSNGGKVSIGNSTPSAKLTVQGNTTTSNNSGIIRLIGSGPANLRMGVHSTYSWIQAHGSKPLRINELGNNVVLNLNGGDVLIGTNANPGHYKLAVNGKVHAKEIKVDLIGWSDFVFGKTYTLPTLKEVEQHIKEKGHLKDIPSAEEVAKNGIFLGEMNAKLLQKIEELTLYVIEQEKQMLALKEKVQQLENQQTK